MNSRNSQELDGLLFTVITQVQGAVDNAINTQILPQVQSSIGAVTRSGPYEDTETGVESLNRTANETSSRNDISGNTNNENMPRHFLYSYFLSHGVTATKCRDGSNKIFEKLKNSKEKVGHLEISY